jgi:dihydroneopterin aldolase
MDQIIVTGISFTGRHGLYADERRDGRHFEVDVIARLDLSAAAQSDRLQDTIDYTQICQVVLSLGEGPSLHLIEALAQQMADAVLALGPIVEVEVEVRKFIPGLLGSPRHLAVRIVRRAAPRQ